MTQIQLCWFEKYSYKIIIIVDKIDEIVEKQKKVLIIRSLKSN